MPTLASIDSVPSNRIYHSPSTRIFWLGMGHRRHRKASGHPKWPDREQSAPRTFSEPPARQCQLYAEKHFSSYWIELPESAVARSRPLLAPLWNSYLRCFLHRGMHQNIGMPAGLATRPDPWHLFPRLARWGTKHNCGTRQCPMLNTIWNH